MHGKIYKESVIFFPLLVQVQTPNWSLGWALKMPTATADIGVSHKLFTVLSPLHCHGNLLMQLQQSPFHASPIWYYMPLQHGTHVQVPIAITAEAHLFSLGDPQASSRLEAKLIESCWWLLQICSIASRSESLVWLFISVVATITVSIPAQAIMIFC